MKFHNGTYKVVTGLLSIAILDLLIGRIWVIASFLAAWFLNLMRNPTRVRSKWGIVSPVNGILKRILNIEINGEKRQHIKISTRAIFDSQVFRLASGYSVSSVTADQNSITIEYTSGMIVKHIPLYQSLGGLVLEGDKTSLENTDEYGYSLFGSDTSVILPASYKLCLSDAELGRVLIDGETVIAMEEEK